MRFGGRDRQEGGTRFDYALRGAWHFPNGGLLEGLAGGKPEPVPGHAPRVVTPHGGGPAEGFG